MSKKHTYVFQLAVKDNFNVNMIHKPTMHMFAEHLSVPVADIKFMGTLDCVSTFIMSTENEAKRTTWLSDIEAAIKADYSEVFSNIKCFHNFKQVGSKSLDDIA